MNTSTKILIVDDDHWSRELLKTMLAVDGYVIDSAESGYAALAKVAVDVPDLILLDLMMPGIDGFEVVKRLKAVPDTHGIPVIMVTALDDAGSRARLLSAGVADVINKPVDRWILQTSIDKVLGDTHGQ
ncbi:response regulator [Methylomonas rapida]|jgi:Response regulator containing a CheY-like receiver domain and an HD-GYP domain|uniref:Response regulator n=1 Tax=Methylomonas rapida TaxID=2963939 RepID=A0ABY7GGM5_9GAMM|nr:response regulator [Methylomonas rapida]WAR44427.1 response regulator [Methylomonas rapida]